MSKHMTKLISGLLFTVLVISVSAPVASAQLQPRISPWMHMFERQTSPMGNYHTLVKPHQDLLQAQALQNQQLQAQQRALQALQSSGGTTGPRDLMTGDGSSVSAGGGTILSPPREIPRINQSPAGFNHYLHYYPPGTLPRKPVPNFSATGSRR